MNENKTKKTNVSVDGFIEQVPNKQRKADAKILVQMMREETKLEPKMWGPTMIGFGDIHYKYPSGREGDTFQVGFSPRQANIALYLADNYDGFDKIIANLGKFRKTVSCTYVNKLSDINMDVLKKLVRESISKGKVLSPEERRK